MLLPVFFAYSATAQLYWDINGRNYGATDGTTAPGTWGVNNFWSTSHRGTTTTRSWIAGQMAVFSAGDNATGTFTVNVSGNQVVSGIELQEGNITLSGGTLTLVDGSGNANIEVSEDHLLQIASQLTGTAGLTKSGNGTLVLSGANSYSGITDLRDGILLIQNNFALGSSSLNLEGGTLGASGEAVTFGGSVTLGGNATIGGTENLTFTGAFSQDDGVRTLTVSNPGLTTFAGDTFTLGTKYNHNLLIINATAGDVLISGTVQDGLARGPDGMMKTGSGTLTLTGNNTFTGGLAALQGTVVLGNDNAAGQGTLSIGNAVTIAGSGGPHFIDNNLLILGNITFSGTDLTFFDPFDLGMNRTFTVDNTTTFAGTISGSGDLLTKNGAGTLVLLTNNTFSGGLTLASGTLVLGNDSAAGPGTLTLGNNVAIESTGGDRTITNNLNVAGNVTFGGTDALLFTDSFALGGDRVFTVDTTTAFSGAISGAGDLVKTGDGTMILSGANTFGGVSNVFSLDAGTVVFASDTVAAPETTIVLNGAAVAGRGGPRTIADPLVISKDTLIGGTEDLTFIGSVKQVAGSHTLWVTNTGLTTFNGPTLTLASEDVTASLTFNVAGSSGDMIVNNIIQDGLGAGPDSIVKSGAGTLTLGGSSPNTFSGGVLLNDGILTAAKADALGSGPLTINSGLLDIGSWNQTVGTVTLASGAIDGTSGILTGSSYQMQSGTVNVTLAGSGSLTKTTPGTLTLSQGSTYTGGTTIDGGTVYVENTSGSATGTGAVTVNNGATLAGNGMILGEITLNSGASLIPGDADGLGTLSTVSETWNSGSEILFRTTDIAIGAGAHWTSIDIDGSLTVNATSNNPIFLNLESLGIGSIQNLTNSALTSWNLVSTTDGIQFGAGVEPGSAFDIMVENFGDLDGGIFSVDVDTGSHDLILYFTPGWAVPEPDSLGLLGLGFLILILRHRLVHR